MDTQGPEFANLVALKAPLPDPGRIRRNGLIINAIAKDLQKPEVRRNINFNHKIGSIYVLSGVNVLRTYKSYEPFLNLFPKIKLVCVESNLSIYKKIEKNYSLLSSQQQHKTIIKQGELEDIYKKDCKPAFILDFDCWSTAHNVGRIRSLINEIWDKDLSHGLPMYLIISSSDKSGWYFKYNYSGRHTELKKYNAEMLVCEEKIPILGYSSVTSIIRFRKQ